MAWNVQGAFTNFEPKNMSIPPIRPPTNYQLAAIFRSFDADKDGQLSVDELKAAFQHLGSYFSYYRAIMARYKADRDKDGKIDLTNDELSELVEYARSCGFKVANKY